MKTQIKINRHSVKTENYLYSVSRTANILGIKENQIEFVMLLDDGRILVGLFNDRRYLTKKDYLTKFAEERKERSQREDLSVTQFINDDTRYTVRNNVKNKTYQIQLYYDSLKCSCPDYEISSDVLQTPQVACKHIYSVLNTLGCSSLKDYVMYQRELAKAQN